MRSLANGSSIAPTPRPPRSTVGMRQRLIEGRAGVAEPGDAGPVAEGGVERLPEHDRDVLDRVVLVGPTGRPCT